MKNPAGSFFDLRKGEYALTFLMAFYYYMILVTYYFLKPARDSLFLVKLGAQQLPVVFILIAIVAVPVTSIYGLASRSLKLNKLLTATTISVMGSILLLRWLLQFEQAWVFYVFYIWVSVFGILMTSQFWLFANAVFDPAQAKRIFALIGLGGILGATTGGEVTGFVVRHMNVKTENLLFFCIICLAVCAGLANIIWKMKINEITTHIPSKPVQTPGSLKKSGFADTFRLIIHSRHLLFIVAIIALTMATASFVDYQFKASSAAAFTSKEDLTVFLGKFYGRLSIVSFLLQLVFASGLVRLLGVGGAILVLPLGLMLGSTFMLISPGLISAVVLRGSDGALKYSIDKTGREFLFLPVPLEIKKRTKLFIDMFIDRWFRGIAGAFLLLFTLVLHFSLRQISIVVIAMLAAWMIVAVLARREYINAFRLALKRREIDPSEIRINVSDSATADVLIEALENEEDRQVGYALDMLRSVKRDGIIQKVLPLLSHSAREIRIKAVKVIAGQNNVSTAVKEVEALIKDTEPEVRIEAMRFMCMKAADDPKQAVESYIADSDPLVRSAAVVCAAMDSNRSDGFPVSTGVLDILLKIPGKEGVVCRVQVAKAIGYSWSPSLLGYLLSLLKDKSVLVVNEALKSAGRAGASKLIPAVISLLESRQSRAAAREALSSFGPAVLETLAGYMQDDNVSITIKHSIPRILGMVPSDETIEKIFISLSNEDAHTQYLLVKALNQLRKNHPDLKIDKERVADAVAAGLSTYYEVFSAGSRIKENEPNEKSRLLMRALEEALDLELEKIFRLFSLVHPRADIYSSYLAIKSSENNLRSNAVEFLENLLGRDEKKSLFPVIDQVSVESVIKRGKTLFNIDINNREQAFSVLMKSKNNWLKTCAVETVGGA